MAINNIVNLAGTGIMSFDGVKVFTALAIPLTVANGGTGSTTFTAYTVICAGTTSTGAFQNVASVGTSGQGLTSSGAGSLPVFDDLGGYTFNWQGQSSNPADSTTYAIVNGFANSTVATGFASTRFYVPKSGTILAASGGFSGTAGSSESATIKLIVNNTTDVNISTSLNFSSLPLSFTNTSLNQAVSAGDYIDVKWVTPAWATNPTSIQCSITVYIR